MTRTEMKAGFPKAYPGVKKFLPEITVSRNYAEVAIDDTVLGIFALTGDTGLVVCGCARCRKSGDGESTDHDLVVGPPKSNDSAVHVSGGLNRWRKELRSMYPNLKTGEPAKELKALRLVESKPKPTAKKRRPVKRAAKKAAAGAKRTAKKAVRKAKASRPKARKPASKK